MSADLVQHYLFYLQDWFRQALQSAGLGSNICDSDISSNGFSSRPRIQPGRTNPGIVRVLDITAPGTALDTVYGKYIMEYLHRLSLVELCTTENVFAAYIACVMSSDDKSEKGKFNILQFAHQALPINYHGAQCSRLDHFTECWNLLHGICGSKVRGLEQHATLSMESCKIQSEMDTYGCHWQDMLLQHYINANRVTVWPLVAQCLRNPMTLDNAHYSTFNSVMDDLNTANSLLQRGVDEISKICGSQPAKRLSFLLNKLRYLQRDAIKKLLLLNDVHTAK